MQGAGGIAGLGLAFLAGLRYQREGVEKKMKILSSSLMRFGETFVRFGATSCDMYMPPNVATFAPAVLQGDSLFGWGKPRKKP